MTTVEKRVATDPEVAALKDREMNGGDIRSQPAALAQNKLPAIADAEPNPFMTPLGMHPRLDPHPRSLAQFETSRSEVRTRLRMHGEPGMKAHQSLQTPAVKGLYDTEDESNQGRLHAVSLSAPKR